MGRVYADRVPFDQFDAMFGLMQAFFVIFFVVVVGGIIFAIVKQSRISARNAVAPEVSAAAMVVDKRIETHGGGEMSVSQRHYVAFEQPSGERFELEVPASEYGVLVVGDRGTVNMKGTKYLGFAREIMR